MRRLLSFDFATLVLTSCSPANEQQTTHVNAQRTEYIKAIDERAVRIVI